MQNFMQNVQTRGFCNFEVDIKFLARLKMAFPKHDAEDFCKITLQESL
jgi:hypothetical protein